MNENLMALLEAVLTLAASDAVALRRPIRPAIKPGGYSEDIFLDLAEDEQEELSCNIWFGNCLISYLLISLDLSGLSCPRMK